MIELAHYPWNQNQYKGYVINPSTTVYSGAFNMVEVNFDNLDPWIKKYSGSLNILEDDTETFSIVDFEESIVEKKLYPLRSIQKASVPSEQTLCQDVSGMSNYVRLQDTCNSARYSPRITLSVLIFASLNLRENLLFRGFHGFKFREFREWVNFLCISRI